MSYMKSKFSPKKPPPNPIVLGCFGTMFIAAFYGIGYGVITLLGQRMQEFTPQYLKAVLEIPNQLNFAVFGFPITIPIPLEAIFFAEMTLVVVLLLGLSSMLYSYYHQATREKEGWELYAEEAERQAKMAKGRR